MREGGRQAGWESEREEGESVREGVRLSEWEGGRQDGRESKRV